MMMWPFFDDGAGRERPGAPDADALLALRVATALEANDLTRGHAVEVGVQHGVAILAGVVDTRRTRDEITARVRQTPGVRDVSDALQVRGGTPTDEHGGIAQHDWTDDFDAIAARLVSDPPAPARSARPGHVGGPGHRGGDRPTRRRLWMAGPRDRRQRGRPHHEPAARQARRRPISRRFCAAEGA